MFKKHPPFVAFGIVIVHGAEDRDRPNEICIRRALRSGLFELRLSCHGSGIDAAKSSIRLTQDDEVG
jgi:hypothetical protein